MLELGTAIVFTFKITGNHRGDDDKDSAKRRRLEEKGVRCVAGK